MTSDATPPAAPGDLVEHFFRHESSRLHATLLSQLGLQHLARAASGYRLTEYHLQAGIAACHGLAADVGSTDWSRILAHYDALLELKPSAVVELNRAVALANLEGPRAGLAALEAIRDPDSIAARHLAHAVQGELRLQLGEHAEAAKSFRRALELARVGPEQDHLARMLERVLGERPWPPPVPGNGP